MLNFTFIIKKNSVAGSKLENGSWTGQIGKNENELEFVTILKHFSFE